MNQSLESPTREAPEALSADELSAVSGGRFIHIYGKDGHYSGSNVNSPWKQRKNKKR